MRFDIRTIGVFEVLSVQMVADEVFDAGRLRQETLRLVERGSRRIVIDLGGVDYLYSDSINALVALNRRMLESSGRMGILVPHPKVYDILVRAGLENIMRLYRSEAELQGDSRELMRQSSAWTRPAELLSAATASQMISASALAPKNPGELRDAASASQRMPRRRVGSRVEVKPRRRGGRGQDQDPDQSSGEFILPPQLPILPGESSTLRTLSQDSSTFDRGGPPAPRPAPEPVAEPTVFHIPENTQHDGYSTDAWLLALTAQGTVPNTPAQMVADSAAGSSSFLPKVSAPGPVDTPSQFPSELRWDEPVAPPPVRAQAPPPAWIPPPIAPAAILPVPPPPPVAPPAPKAAPAPAAANPFIPTPAPSKNRPGQPSNPAPSVSPFLDSPYASAFLDSAVSETSASTFSANSNDSANSRPEPPADPWRPKPFQPIPQPDVQSALFYDPITPAARTNAEASRPEFVSPPIPAPPPPAAKRPDPVVAAPPVTPPRAVPTPAPAPEAWFNGAAATPVAAKPAAVPPAPPPKVAASAKSDAANIDTWFAPESTPSPKPTRPAAKAPAAPAVTPEPSALDWISPTPKAAPAPAPAPSRPAPKPETALDSWITQPTAAAPSPWKDPLVAESRPRPPKPAKDPTSFLDLDDLDEPPPSKKGLWIVLILLAIIAVLGLGFFFFGGSKPVTAEIPPSSKSADTLPTPVVTPPAPEEIPTPAPAPEKPSETKRPTAKPEPKPDPKKGKGKTSAAPVAAKPVAAAIVAPPEEDHAPIKVFVTSRPSGAALQLDGSRVGTTPCEITVKRAGKLELSLAGYRKQVTNVDPEETRGTLNIQLASDAGNSSTGRMYITSAPAGAEVLFGGKVLCKTPHLVDLPTGPQKVMVRSGVLSKTRTLDIQSGTNAAEHFSL